MTPDEIAAKEFETGLRGYDVAEVRAYLQVVAAELRAVGSGGDRSTSSLGEADGSPPIEGSPAAHRSDPEVDRALLAATAEVESMRARATAILVAAQDEALRLVSEVHARIDLRVSGGDAGTVEQLGSEIRTLIETRDAVVDGLVELCGQLDEVVEASGESSPGIRADRSGSSG